MTPKEIQALRKKHQPVEWNWNNGRLTCDVCLVIDDTSSTRPHPYPCDVIKVLDALADLLATRGVKL